VLGRLISYYKIKNNLRLPQFKLDKLINNKFKNIINHSYEKIPFYRQKFDEEGINPQNIHSVNDIEKLPLTIRSEVQQNPIKELISPDVDVNICGTRRTSGSTGVPIKLFVNKEASEIDAATWNRAYFENGLKYFDKMAVIRTERKFAHKNSIFKKLGILRREYILIHQPPETIFNQLIKTKPDVIQTAGSLLFNIARQMPDAKKINPRLTFTSVELLDEAIRETITSTYKTELFDYYSCEEFASIAWECKEHSGYHINADNIIVEVLKNNQPVEPGESGEIYITSLNNYAQPFIRYKLGDIVKLIDSKEKCPCGVSFPKIEVIEGRDNDFITTLDGNVVSIVTLGYMLNRQIRETEGIINFQIIQEKINKIKYNIVINDNFKNRELFITNQIQIVKGCLGDEMNVEVNFVDKINRDPSGKLRTFISNVSKI